MVFHVVTRMEVLASLFSEDKELLRYEELYIDATSTQDALDKAKKYLEENKGSHLSIMKIEQLPGKLLT